MAAYSDIATLSKDAAFLGRLSVAVAKFMDYVLNESTATDNHTKRWNWAASVARSGPESVVGSIALMVAYDANIQAVLGAASDVEIQNAVETWIGRLFQL
jgi:hypothetical protein